MKEIKKVDPSVRKGHRRSAGATTKILVASRQRKVRSRSLGRIATGARRRCPSRRVPETGSCGGGLCHNDKRTIAVGPSTNLQEREQCIARAGRSFWRPGEVGCEPGRSRKGCRPLSRCCRRARQACRRQCRDWLPSARARCPVGCGRCISRGSCHRPTSRHGQPSWNATQSRNGAQQAELCLFCQGDFAGAAAELETSLAIRTRMQRPTRTTHNGRGSWSLRTRRSAICGCALTSPKARCVHASRRSQAMAHPVVVVRHASSSTQSANGSPPSSGTRR
jgi:hypothetical protein